MSRRVRCIAGLAILTLSTFHMTSVCFAQQPSNLVQIEVFVRGDKPSASTVREYLADLNRRVPGLEIFTYDVLQDQKHLARLYEITEKSGRSKPVVPAFYCCDRLYFGFESAEKTGPAIENLFTVEVYTRNTCPRCKAAKTFIAGLRTRWPAIRFRIHEVTNDANARARWEALCRSSGSAPGLPTFDFGGHVIIGYQGDHITGVQLEQLIARQSRIKKKQTNQ